MKARKRDTRWMHPVAKTAADAARRCQTLARRLRYRGDTYNADIAEHELLPFLRAQTPVDDLINRPRSMGGDGIG